jgi:DNA polymerase
VQDLPPSAPQLVPEQPSRDHAAPSSDAAEPVDWRAALRAADAAPGPPARPSRPMATGTGAPTGSPEDDVARRAGGAGGGKPPAAESGGTTAGAPAAGAPFPGTDIPTGLVVGGAAGELFGGPLGELRTLEEIATTVRACTRCPLYKTATHGVPGEGNPTADFMVVGEAPGAEEDASGRPFVGASGQLLTKILAAINLRREDVFIANVVKHRPPGNRNPAPDEVAACSPYLIRQIELVRPRVILTVGNFAAQTLLDTKLGIGKLRGQVHVYHGVPLIATYHPAALLRNPAWKRPTWEDVQLARRLFDRAAPG